MRSRTIIYIALFGLIAGCQKYEHNELSNPDSCDLCPHASTLEGTYRGEVYKLEFGTGNISNDSATMTVQQIFMNNNTYDDSTTMYFATTYVHDSSANLIAYDTINIHDTYGIARSGNYERLWIRNDTLLHQRFIGAPLPGLDLIFEGVFLKI
jgi:hypothetical protein